MALMLVPYTNAMRLGQGFNSYSQQICIDNAVIGIMSRDDVRPFVTADMVNTPLPKSSSTASSNTLPPQTPAQLPSGTPSSSTSKTSAPTTSTPTTTASTGTAATATTSTATAPAAAAPTTSTTAATGSAPTGTITAPLSTITNADGTTTTATLIKSYPPMARMPPQTSLLDELNAEREIYPSQIVTFTSQYVSKLSDVSKSLNVSGKLSITYGEISGGGSGSYVNSDTFQSSAVNFLLTVKVINQVISVRDDLAFWPLERDYNSKVDAATLTNTYGDCFISGFQEGGTFNAIISIGGIKEGNEETIKAAAHLALQVGLGSVTADADVTKEKKSLNEDSEVSITVNWCGGGQLKQSDEKWSIDEVIAVATRFPDMVAACPQRTHAILTKYTSLRGFLEWQSKTQTASPLNYDLCQLYTADLLDVYMGYKAVWKWIHNLLQDLDDSTQRLIPGPGFLRANGTSVEVTIPGSNGRDKLTLFDADYVGLDNALKMCRRLMVLIVNEVDALQKDPKIAIDISRETPYIRSQIFRRYLPVESPPAPPAPPTIPPLPSGPVPDQPARQDGLLKYAVGKFLYVNDSASRAFVNSFPTRPSFGATPLVLAGLAAFKHKLRSEYSSRKSTAIVGCANNSVNNAPDTVYIGTRTLGSPNLATMAMAYAALECPAFMAGTVAFPGDDTNGVPSNSDQRQFANLAFPPTSVFDDPPATRTSPEDRIAEIGPSVIKVPGSTPNPGPRQVLVAPSVEMYYEAMLPGDGFSESTTSLAWPTSTSIFGSATMGATVYVRAGGGQQKISINLEKSSGEEVLVQWVAFPTSLPGVAGGYTKFGAGFGLPSQPLNIQEDISLPPGKFTTPPRVFVALAGWKWTQITASFVELTTTTSNIRTTGFTVNITANMAGFTDATFAWLAIGGGVGQSVCDLNQG